MTNADPKLLERLSQITSQAHARSAAIADRARRQAQELAERAEQRRQANEERSKELDQQAEQRRVEKDDPTAKNQWLQRSETQDLTYRFGEDDAQETPAQPAPPPVPALEQPKPLEQPPRERRGRHARPVDDFDDDDFSNNSWMQ